MPVYEFLCRDCDNRYDDLLRADAVDDQNCPDCRSADVVKLYSPFSVKCSRSDSVTTAGGACMPGPAMAGGGGGCCGGGCGGCG